METNIMDNEAMPRPDRYPVVAVRSDWARQFGTLNAIWLSQATFTQARKGEGKWWYKNRCAKYDESKRMLPPANSSEQSFEWETGLTRSQQETARALFRALGILKEQQRGIPKRIEYLIDFKRLAEINAQWAIDTCGPLQPTVLQNTAVLKENSCHMEGEGEHSSTESLKKETSKGRRGSANCKNSHLANGPRDSAEIKVARLSTSLGGIQCWTDQDRLNANGLLEQFGEVNVAAAVQKIECGGKSPLPSRVRLALCEPRGSNDVDRTTEMMDRYNDDETKKMQRRAAQIAIRALTKSRLDEFRCQFLGQNAKLQATSLVHATGKWTNLAAKLQFDRWLENQFINGSSLG